MKGDGLSVGHGEPTDFQKDGAVIVEANDAHGVGSVADATTVADSKLAVQTVLQNGSSTRLGSGLTDESDCTSIDTTPNTDKFNYITWEEFKRSGNSLGLDYQKSYNKLFDKYNDSFGEKGNKRSPFYHKTIEAAKTFIKNKYSDKKVTTYKKNAHLSEEQKTKVENILLELGIQYQLEMATIVVACLDKPESYDTLYYQNAVGSSLESIVAEHNNVRPKGYNAFEIREKRKLKIKIAHETTEAIKNPEKEKKKTTEDIPGHFTDYITVGTFKLMCESIVADSPTEHLSGERAFLEPEYSNDYKGRKVIAPISISSSCAAAAGYNTEVGVQGLLQELDPNVEELTLVRCDAVHLWTELQAKVHDIAATGTSENLEMYLGKIFDLDEENEFVLDEATGFRKLNLNQVEPYSFSRTLSDESEISATTSKGGGSAFLTEGKDEATIEVNLLEVPSNALDKQGVSDLSIGSKGTSNYESNISATTSIDGESVFPPEKKDEATIEVNLLEVPSNALDKQGVSDLSIGSKGTSNYESNISATTSIDGESVFPPEKKDEDSIGVNLLLDVSDLSGTTSIDGDSVMLLKEETEKSGETWEKKLFVPILKVLRDNHFKNCKASTSKINEIIVSKLKETQGASEAFSDKYDYKSTLDLEKEQLKNITAIYTEKLRPLIDNWIRDANEFMLPGSSPSKSSPISESKEEDASALSFGPRGKDGSVREKLGQLALVMSLIDNKCFVEALSKMKEKSAAATKDKRFNYFTPETINDIYKKAGREYIKLLDENESVKKELIDELHQLAQCFADKTEVRGSISMLDEYIHTQNIALKYFIPQGVFSAEDDGRDLIDALKKFFAELIPGYSIPKGYSEEGTDPVYEVPAPAKAVQSNAQCLTTVGLTSVFPEQKKESNEADVISVAKDANKEEGEKGVSSLSRPGQ